MAKQKGKRGGARKNAGGKKKPPPPEEDRPSDGDGRRGGGGKGKGKRNRRPPNRFQPVHDEDTAFREKLLDQGKVVHEMSADGNCLFRSVSDQLYDDRGAKHDVVRHDVCEHLSSHREEFRHFLLMGDDDEDVIDIDEYISNMRRDGEWGGNVEVVAASRAYRRGIVVFSGEYANGALSVPCDDGDGDGGDLLLSYHGNDHYNSVRPTSGPSAGPSGGPSSATTNNNKKKGAADGKAPGATRRGAAPMKLEMSRGRPPTRGAACPCGSGLRYKKCCMAAEKRKKRLAGRSGGSVAGKNGAEGPEGERGDEFIGDFKVLAI